MISVMNFGMGRELAATLFDDWLDLKTQLTEGASSL